MNVNDTNNQRMLPVLPLRGLTAFPDMLIHFDVGRAMSIKALEAAMKDGQWIFLTAQKDLKTDRPTADDLYEVGTICIIKQILRLPGDNIRVLVEGKDRARALHYQKSEDGGECLKAQVEVLYDILPLGGERREQALVRTVQNRFEEYAALAPRLSSDVALTVAAGGNAGYLADYIAQNIPIDFSVKQEVLEELNVNRRLTFLIRLLTEETEILRIEGDIQEQIKAAIDKNQKDYYLREQIKVIQSELGEQDVSAEAEEYREKIEKLGLPEESASKRARRQNGWPR